MCNLQQSPRLLKLCGGETTKSNSNELPISVPLSLSSIPLRGPGFYPDTDYRSLPSRARLLAR
ncbi:MULTISPECIES: hypothetical protein [unclassified Streptococcus]|uniref:hypothetical protein n=1 Tax=unclassified Streptococcus TaxID=2608887 RepID=UPI001EFA714A|nr:hypothetical protein [Streptococcus sp. 343_SSPC]